MSEERYSHVECRKKEGAHYTPDSVSDFIAGQIVGHACLKESMKVIDPAVGDGELLVSLISSLVNKGVVDVEAHAFDINKKSLEITKERIFALFPDIKLVVHHRDFLQACLEKSTQNKSQNLFVDPTLPEFDLLIANPPYIRTQVLGAEAAQQLSKNFGLKGKVDIYQAFMIAMTTVLKKESVAGVIVSNRFMTTKGAGKFRERLFDLYDIQGIWDFGDTKVFDAAVLPAVIVMKPAGQHSSDDVIPFSSVYLEKSYSELPAPEVTNQVEALSYNGLVKAKKDAYLVKHGTLIFDQKPSDVWRLQDEESEKWLSSVAEATWCQFKDIGKIRVGVKTTADNVFIHADWLVETGFEPELLQTLTTHHVAERYKVDLKNSKKILYTHENFNGKKRAVDIDHYPVSRRYLESHRKQLEGRKYVISAGRNWYEIWVPQKPELWCEPKLVFRDICEEPTFWLDETGSIVNGDCYWMLNDYQKETPDLIWLVLGVANSSFIETFYDMKFQNKLYSNKRRFISQYVEQFPVPDPVLSESQKIIELTKICYRLEREHRAEAEAEINALVLSAFRAPALS
ncbi:MAG: N-6 DNA methylase [Marinobacterium sp.]|nr:N-6 DNA methylase [Marinobacterium sp.]